MLDLLYKFRKHNVNPALVGDHIKAYLVALKNIANVEMFDPIINNYDYSKGNFTELINLILAEVKPRIRNNRLMRGTDLLMQGVGIGEISKIIYKHHLANIAERGGPEATYMLAYAWWTFDAIQEMMECICYNGGISQIELVGPRTKEYIKVLGLENSPKRFGTPNDRWAYPQWFHTGAFSLSSPPMTTRTHTRDYIKRLYQFFNFGDFYEIKLPKTTFARIGNFRDPNDNKLDLSDYSKTRSDVSSYTDLNCSFVYDMFIFMYLDRLSNLIIDENITFINIPKPISGTINFSDNYLELLKVNEDKYSLAELITLVY